MKFFNKQFGWSNSNNAPLFVPSQNKSIQILTNSLDDDGAFSDVKVPLVVTSKAVPVGSYTPSINSGLFYGIQNAIELGDKPILFGASVYLSESGTSTIYGDWNSSDSARSAWFRVNASNQVELFLSFDGSTSTTYTATGVSLSLSTLHDVQACRVEDVIMIYVDGVLAGSTTCPTGPLHSSGYSPWLYTVSLDGSTAATTFKGANLRQFLIELPKRPDLHILWGQSNITGQADDYADLDAEHDAPQIHRYAGDTNNGVMDVNDIALQPVGATAQRACLDLWYGDALFKRTSRQHAICKVSKGGSSIKEWQDGDTYYENSVDTINTFISTLTGRGYTIGDVYFVAQQGESDASEQNAEDWKTLFPDLVGRFQRDCNVTFKQVVLARLNTNYTYIRESQEYVIDKYGYTMLDTDTYTLSGDNVHYNIAGLANFGTDAVELLNLSEYSSAPIYDYTLAEGGGDTVYNRASSNHAIGGGVTWVLSEIPNRADNLTDGFYAAVQGVPPYIPASLLDPTIAANGLAITNLGTDTTNAFHNGAETLMVETDLVNGDLLPRTTLSANGTSFDAHSYAYYYDHYLNRNGFEGIWIKLHTDGISLKIFDVKDLDWHNNEMPLDQYDRLVSFFGGGVVPFSGMLVDDELPANTLIDDEGNILK